MKISEKAKKIVRRIFRITLTTVLVILGIILLILVLIQTGPVQNYGRGKIEAYLEKKLQTKVRIGNLYIDFPARIIIKNIYLEDRRKDTLISGGKIEVDISMFRLLHKELRVNNLELDNVTLKVKRLMPDSVFNFQFIADAFSSPEKEPVKKDTSAGFQFIIGDIRLHHVYRTAQNVEGLPLLLTGGYGPDSRSLVMAARYQESAVRAVAESGCGRIISDSGPTNLRRGGIPKFYEVNPAPDGQLFPAGRGRHAIRICRQS